MNLDLFHCAYVILCVCNLAKMIITVEGNTLVDTITNGYDQRLAAHYQVKKGSDYAMRGVQSQSSLHKNTDVNVFRNYNYKLTRWMYTQRRSMMNAQLTYEKVDEKNGNHKPDDSASIVSDISLDKQLDLLLLHYPTTYARRKRDLSKIGEKNSRKHPHNLGYSSEGMTRGKRVVFPARYESGGISEFPDLRQHKRQTSEERIKETNLDATLKSLLTKVAGRKNMTTIGRTGVPFKKNPIPQQKTCTECLVRYIPTFEETKQVDSAPEVNLNIVPLGAIFIFFFIFCFKTFNWIVYDMRERDEKNFEIYKPRKIHPRRQSIFITRQSSTSSSSGFGALGDSHSTLRKNHTQSQKRKPREKPSTLGLMAASGLLPGIPALATSTQGPNLLYENETPQSQVGGTSPVANTSVAAAMTANIPMAIAFTMRQISDEKNQRNSRKMLNVSQGSNLNRLHSNESKRSTRSPSPKIFVHDTSADSTVSDVTLGYSYDSLGFTLPKPTWSDQERSASAPSGEGVHERGLDPHNYQQSKDRFQRTKRNSYLSDAEHSAPSSPASSSRTSIVSSLSDSSVDKYTNKKPPNLCESRHAPVPIENLKPCLVSSANGQNDANGCESDVSNVHDVEKSGKKLLCGSYDTNFDAISLHYTALINNSHEHLTIVDVHVPSHSAAIVNDSGSHNNSTPSSAKSVHRSVQSALETDNIPHLNGYLSQGDSQNESENSFDGYCITETQL